MKNIEHIKDIVAMQQTYARVSGAGARRCPWTDLIEDALAASTSTALRTPRRHRRARIRHPSPPPSVDKHKVLQILINIIRNATLAMDEGCSARKAPDHFRIRPLRRTGRVAISPHRHRCGHPGGKPHEHLSPTALPRAKTATASASTAPRSPRSRWVGSLAAHSAGPRLRRHLHSSNCRMAASHSNS